MITLTERAHTLIRVVLRPADVAIDATVGNGHDTLFLADCVGPQGIVYGFDIQQEALTATKRRLQETGLQNVVLLDCDHAAMEAVLPISAVGVRAVMFNLGFLPGGNKQLTTQVDSTIAAIQAALRLLAPNGLMTIVAYTGHPGGDEEARAVSALLQSLPADDFEVAQELSGESRVAAPRLFVVRKRR